MNQVITVHVFSILFPFVCFVCIGHHVFICLCFPLGSMAFSILNRINCSNYETLHLDHLFLRHTYSIYPKAFNFHIKSTLLNIYLCSLIFNIALRKKAFCSNIRTGSVSVFIWEETGKELKTLYLISKCSFSYTMYMCTGRCGWVHVFPN